MNDTTNIVADDYRISTLDNSSVFNIYLEREFIQVDPPYQRQSDVWPLSKRQLLIDSILNGFDIPKFYVHQFFPAKKIKGSLFKYAVVDGKQRLQTLWSFIEDKFPLDADFSLISDPSIKVAGMTYSQLAKAAPRLRAIFDSKLLTIVAIQTADTELIEEMFSRLNEAAPLNAPEKRNALGGPLPPIIRSMAKHDFFSTKLPFTNRRYRHFDLACKLLLLENEGKCVPTYKIDLDLFAESAKSSMSDRAAKSLQSRCFAILDRMLPIFEAEDDLLRSGGLNMVYYMLFRTAIGERKLSRISRAKLVAFEERRLFNRENAEADITKADFELLEFDRLTQSPNDGGSMNFRLEVLKREILGD